jgi:hypothetical protein
MNDEAADHALGIELQLEEIVERRERARAQHQVADEIELTRQIVALQTELATVVDNELQ